MGDKEREQQRRWDDLSPFDKWLKNTGVKEVTPEALALAKDAWAAGKEARGDDDGYVEMADHKQIVAGHLELNDNIIDHILEPLRDVTREDETWFKRHTRLSKYEKTPVKRNQTIYQRAITETLRRTIKETVRRVDK